MEISKQNQQRNILALPSTAEASFYIFHAYYEKTIRKVRTFLQQFCISLSKVPCKQKKKYSSITNQQICQRGYFLHYIYQCILSLHQISKHSFLLYKPIEGKRPFESFINDLFFTIDDLAKLTRIKRNCKTQEIGYNELNKQIIELLYYTEIYAYQMLLRVIQIKIIYEQQLNYRRDIEQLHQKYIFSDCLSSDKLMGSKKQKMVMRRLFSQIQSIYMYYHCEVSINRTECNSKPEINSLLYLLKNKLSKPFLLYVRERFNFRCEGELIVPYTLPFSTIQQQVAQMPNNQPNSKEEDLNVQPSEMNRQCQQQPQVQQKYHLSQSVHQMLSKKQSAQSQSNPSEIILTIKQENEQEIAIYASKKEEDLKLMKQTKLKFIDKEKKSNDASDDDYIQSKVKHLKYERTDQIEEKNYQKSRPSKHSLKNLSMKEKMKVLGHNQRFAHTLCNIKYVMTSKSSKKEMKRQKQQQNSFKLNSKVNPIIHFAKQKDQSEDSFLAEQTPIHRHRNFINKT